MKMLLQLLLSVGSGALTALAGGFVLSKQWEWFVVPKFHLPTLSYLDGVGIMLVVSLFFVNISVDVRASRVTEVEDIWSTTIGQQLAVALITYPLMLLSGYIWHQFI